MASLVFILSLTLSAVQLFEICSYRKTNNFDCESERCLFYLLRLSNRESSLSLESSLSVVRGS